MCGCGHKHGHHGDHKKPKKKDKGRDLQSDPRLREPVMENH